MWRQLNYSNTRRSPVMLILLTLLLSLKIAAGGSISSSHKAKSTQQHQPQQQMVAQQQQQPNLQQQQQSQQQVPSVHQRMHPQNANSQIQQQEQVEQGVESAPNVVSSDISSADFDIDEEINDPYQYLNDLKMEPRLTAGNGLAWSPYSARAPNQTPAHMPTMFNGFPYTRNPYGTFDPSALAPVVTPRFLPFLSYPQPVYFPLPMYLAAATSDVFYQDFSGDSNEIDDSMPRAIGDQRRVLASSFGSTHNRAGMGPPTPPPSARNSQIYFMRLAPMPYSMFMPGGLGFTAMSGSLPAAVDPYNPLSSALSPILNIPINFMANGKPTNIYQIGGTPSDFGSSAQFNNVNPFGLRPPAPFAPTFSFGGAQRPVASNVGVAFASQGSYGLPSPAQSHSAQLQDSKLTLLKRPFFFNGRPEEIYTLPNNFNPIYGNSGYY